LIRGDRSFEVTQRLVGGAGIRQQRLAESRAGFEIVPVLGDRLAELSDRLIEILAPSHATPRPR